MKIAILVAALTAVAHAGVVVQQGPAALIESGSSRVARTEDSLGNYAFGYDEVHTSGGSFRREQSSPDGQVTGSYGLRDADGRLRTVNYIADAAGFRAAITSNEPGVESKNTAGVLINQGEVPPGPVVDETVLVAGPGRLVAARGQLIAAPAALAGPAIAAAPAQLLAPSAPAQLLAAPQQLVAAAPAPIQFASQIAHAGLAAQATAPLNHGPILGAAGISAPVLAQPGLDIFGRLSNAAVPTVNSNPLTDGPFARFNRPAISTPAALATGPLAAPLNPWQTTPLASPQLAASGQLLSAPIAPGPLAPGLAVSGQLFQSQPLFAHQSQLFAPQVARQQLIAQQPLLAPQQLVAQPLLQQQQFLAAPQQQILAAPQQLVAQQPLLRQQLLAPQQQILLQQQRLAAPVAVAGPAAIAGITYQTQINHALAPAAALAAPIHQSQVAY